jgi:hypothetical protein
MQDDTSRKDHIAISNETREVPKRLIDQTKTDSEKRVLEADGGNGGDDLTELQLVQNGGLTGGIQTDHLEKK